MLSPGSIALLLFGFLAYFNAIQHPFVHDDVVFILQNPHIADLGHWYQAFYFTMAGDGINTYYRPVLEILYRLEYHFFGPNPFGFHLFNIFVHIVNGLLIFGLLQKLGFRKILAWVIACIFLIHPVQTEAVCCISGISNLWMALGVLLALHTYLNRWYTASLLCFAMAFLSKEQAVMFVPLVIVLDLARGEKNYISWLFWCIVTCFLLWVRQSITGASLIKDIMLSPGELILRLAAIPRVLGMDLRLIFCPYDLHYYRSTDILQSNVIAWIFGVLTLLGIYLAYRRWPQAQKMMILGLGWFLASLFPVLNIAPLVNEYSFILTSEHFLYLPIVGILILVVLGADHCIKHTRKLLVAVVLSTCLLLTWYQNTFWNSEIALFERMLIYEPDFGRGHLLLAKAYYFNGRPDLAEKHYLRSYTIMTNYARKANNLTAEKFYLVFLKEILFDWAQNESVMGHWRQALDKYKQAIAIDGKDASLYNNMAFAYLHLGDKKDAIQNLRQALQVDPTFEQARINLQAMQVSGKRTFAFHSILCYFN